MTVGNLVKILLTPLSFMIVLDVVVIPSEPHEPIRAIHCFHNTPLLMLRILENIVFAVCFLTIPGVRKEGDFEDWLSSTPIFGAISLVAVFVIFTTWIVILNSAAHLQATYSRQMDEN